MTARSNQDHEVADRHSRRGAFATDLFTGLNLVVFVTLIGCVAAAAALYLQGF